MVRVRRRKFQLKISVRFRLALVPPGRPPKSIDPNASSGHRLGFEVRSARTREGLTLEALGDWVGFTPQHISEVELAKVCPSEAFVAAVDRALDADGQLLALLEAVVIERAFERQRRASARRGAATLDDDVKRRAFLGLGLAVVLLGPDAVARASRDDWDRIAYEWSRELFIAPDRQALLPGLAADLKRLSANGGPQHAIAWLSAYAAMIATSGGDEPLAKRWWLRAQRAAAAEGDARLTAYVLGQHSVHALYRGAPARALTLADETLAAASAPCAGRMHALTASAKALAVLGRKREARAALNAAEVEFERLPRDITREKISVNGWAEERLHHTRSYTTAFGGGGDGEPARAAALRLYSPVAWRGPAQVKLHRAATETDSVYALATLTALTDPQRSDRTIRQTAAKVLAVCESRDASAAGVADLREVLSAA